MRRFTLAATRTLAVYGFVAWVYIAVVSIVQPATLHLQLTHFATWPHDDTFGELSFAVSLVSYFTYSMLKHRDGDMEPRSSRRGDGP